ncbi:hypothetical protein FRX31_004890 [Thalictrum thalictroides]|uniref:Uncharacterized protein n=1 Tax=Thalictrum thalictroides TaxID=46969 RepID=A0A7J6XAQ2_THATH|nr:hypothetical protein FRX31_004890 [Thalictrum thalictroides]
MQLTSKSDSSLAIVEVPVQNYKLYFYIERLKNQHSNISCNPAEKADRGESWQINNLQLKHSPSSICLVPNKSSVSKLIDKFLNIDGYAFPLICQKRLQKI